MQIGIMWRLPVHESRVYIFLQMCIELPNTRKNLGQYTQYILWIQYIFIWPNVKHNHIEINNQDR